MNTNAVRLNSISKRYTLRHEKPTLVGRLMNEKNETFWALKNINLDINKGEKLGIIGPNGSGKTTLLKIIAGITSPTTGTVQTKGKVVSLIDLEAGFHPDLTGEQNIYINGIILGMSKKEIASKINKIIKYADIGQFIDTPIYTYSSGMKLRLGFSIAINSNPDILILDEIMSVGDKNFKNKSFNTIKKFFKKNVTIIMVSHWTEIIEKCCNQVIILNKGNIKKQTVLR